MTVCAKLYPNYNGAPLFCKCRILKNMDNTDIISFPIFSKTRKHPAGCFLILYIGCEKDFYLCATKKIFLLFAAHFYNFHLSLPSIHECFSFTFLLLGYEYSIMHSQPKTQEKQSQIPLPHSPKAQEYQMLQYQPKQVSKQSEFRW